MQTRVYSNKSILRTLSNAGALTLSCMSHTQKHLKKYIVIGEDGRATESWCSTVYRS